MPIIVYDSNSLKTPTFILIEEERIFQFIVSLNQVMRGA